MNVFLTPASMVPHVMMKLMGIPVPVWMDTLELTVNQVFIKLCIPHYEAHSFCISPY